MEDINQIFLAAFTYFVERHKTQKEFADRVGMAPSYVSDILKGRRPCGDENVRRRTAAWLGFGGRRYEDFLDHGRRALDGQDPGAVPEPDEKLPGSDAAARGFLAVPYSEGLTLGPGGQVRVTAWEEESPVMVHGPSIGRTTALGLQAFRAGDDSMEPLVFRGDVMVVDTLESDPGGLTEGDVYLVCLDLKTRECSFRFLSWAEKEKAVLVSGMDVREVRPETRRPGKIKIVGRVVWMCRSAGR
jgi:transcriptional regulator with XRE-family HTH domain